MPRTRRSFGSNGYIHIVARGVNKQNIFLDDKDYVFFLSILEDLKKEMDFEITAYCLMSNHVHLLIHDKEKRFPEIMHRINGRYAMHFNRKYERSGHLFQNRYLCKSILTTGQLLSTVCYIHNNPLKAYICKRDNYIWSSYNEYISKPTLCTTDYVLSLVQSKDSFINMHDNISIKRQIELGQLESPRSVSDKELLTYLQTQLGSQDPTAIQSCPKRERNRILRSLKSLHASHRQIARMTGLSLSTIDHA